MKAIKDSLPWPQLLQIAYGTLHLSPDHFWSITPAEWMAALKGWKDSHGLTQGAGGISRDELDAMIRRFPDLLTDAA